MKLLMKIESFLGVETQAEKEINCSHCTDCKVGFLILGRLKGNQQSTLYIDLESWQCGVGEYMKWMWQTGEVKWMYT